MSRTARLMKDLAEYKLCLRRMLEHETPDEWDLWDKVHTMAQQARDIEKELDILRRLQKGIITP